MIIGIPREIKQDEYRVALLPVGAELLVQDGHRVLIERGAGLGSGYEDQAYQAVGAQLIDSPTALYDQAHMIVKVKEPQQQEIASCRPGLILFCYFHFAGSRSLTQACLQKKITAVAYETLADDRGQLPLLTPMSEVAGKMSIQEGAKCLEKPMGGSGILLGGVPGVVPANVLILGGGVVGTNAARVAAGLGANVTIMDINLDRLRHLAEVMDQNVTTIYCDPHAVQKYATTADLVVGAVLVPGSKAPRLLRRDTLKQMKKGAVLVDVSIDQGGCFETSRPTTHSEPVFVVDHVLHYCVTNMPGAVGRTSTQALCNATLPYCRELARSGLDAFAARSTGRAAALNMRNGKLLCPAVSKAFADIPHK